jgi:hypothetical protein
MVTLMASDNLNLVHLSIDFPIEARRFQSGLVCFGATASEEHSLHIVVGKIDQALSQSNRRNIR